MSDDIDLALFGRGSLIDITDRLPEPEPQPEPEPEPAQITMEGKAERVSRQSEIAHEYVMAVVLRSRTGSDRPHIVTVMTMPKGERAVACTCEAFLAIERRPSGCWAMRYVRTIARIPEPGGPA